MTLPPSHALRIALSLLAAGGLVSATVAQQPRPQAVIAAPAKTATPWLYQGSDIPVDTAWTFGVLPNGLRYAVRRNQVPPGQVSIRVAIDAGSLMEREDERGFAHFLEHLSFRGSKFVADGEAKRVWQRLGASFGSDSNATTTPTQTVYRLDLPAATDAGLDESLKILSGMMSAPSISANEVDTERRTVLAEAREARGPQARVGDTMRELFYGGQLLAQRPTIGTDTTLAAATAPMLRAFHDRWYRPDKAVISISGDADPAKLEALIKQHFGSWAPDGPAPADAAFGDPAADGARTRFIVEAGLPTVVSMAWVRPWRARDDTIAYNQGRMIDLVATRIISRRLEQRARAGGSFIQAGVDQEDVARSSDGTFVSILPNGEDWQSALADVRAVIADAIANPPTQAEIDRETNEFTAILDVQVETSRAEASGKQADDIVEAVNIRETVASPEVARDVFAAMKGKIKPADIAASTKKLFSGVGPRVLVSSATKLDNGEGLLALELAKPPKSLASAAALTPVSFAMLPKFGAPGKVVAEAPLTPQLRVDTLTLSNGMKVLLDSNKGEQGRIYVVARWGEGRRALPKDRISSAWAADGALVASGIGTLKQDQLDRLTSGRQINLDFNTDDESFQLRALTREADLKDQLRLMAAKLAFPGWDPAPVTRARSAALVGIATVDSTPQGVLGGELPLILRGGDQRWARPGRAEIEALTPQAFRKFWEPLLAQGPIELSLFGDFDRAAAIAAINETFGALKPRKAVMPTRDGAVVAPLRANAVPIVKTHKGSAEQALAVISWPSGSGRANVFESRQLDILAQIFSDRLFEQFREGEGASYSPDVSSSWPMALQGGGSFTVMSQVKPETVPAFYTRAQAIAADLAAKPVTADELERAVGPMRQMLARATSGNTFWLNQLSGATANPDKVATLLSWPGDLRRMTPEALQQVAAKYLVPGKSASLSILPAK